MGNSSLGAPFALGGNFGEQQTKSLVATPKFPPNTKLPPQILEFDLKTDSAELQNLVKIIAHAVRTLTKFLLLFAFAKRRILSTSSLQCRFAESALQSIKQ